jgi:transcriptional regulator with PAS, ATPase and Fis domain
LETNYKKKAISKALMQAKLLRVIQEKKFIRVGGNSEEESDFRLVCATHRALEESVNQGFFRQDLYFRINTITLSIPPLRQRAEDILDLAQAFLIQAAEENKRSVKKLDEGAAALLVNHEWPGNIRQLQNAIQRAVALVPPEAANAQLTAADFQFLSKKPTSEPLTKLQEAKEDFIRDYVKKAILIHKGNKTKAAKALGVDPKTLYRHLLEDRDGSEET